MLSGLNAFTEKFLLDIGRLQKRTDRAQEKLTSGLKLTKVSDSPDDVSSLLDSRAGLDSAIQVQQNLTRVKVEVDAGEKALQNGVQLLERARVLGAQGSSNLQTAATRAHLAGELQALLERMVAAASTAVEGRYIFSGDADQIAPYQVDLSTPSGVSAYQGAASTRQVADSSGLLFPVAQSADILFDSATGSENVFLAINGMRRALLAVDNPPNPPDPTIPSIEQALGNLGSAALYLNQRLASYGLTQNRVAEAATAASALELSLRARIASIEEADLAEAATDLGQARIGLDAALQARARTPRRSLFDYLG
ncbi:MAG: hypothetical protein HY235_30155 [Acidobacteria bacterium]|nr:hypothetical protein [Acidobacteriota bacterium]